MNIFTSIKEPHLVEGDLFTVYQQINTVVKIQYDEIQAALTSERNICPLSLTDPIFQNIVGKIAKNALTGTDLILHKVLDPTRLSISSYAHLEWNTAGVPCVHVLEDIISTGGTLQCIHFHQFWHLDVEPNVSNDSVDMTSANVQLIILDDTMMSEFVNLNTSQQIQNQNQLRDIIQQHNIVNEPSIAHSCGRPA
ncbi:hypothetical protein HK096_011305, partial [Nowakowskiella sp. JEL0078]